MNLVKIFSLMGLILVGSVGVYGQQYAVTKGINYVGSINGAVEFGYPIESPADLRAFLNNVDQSSLSSAKRLKLRTLKEKVDGNVRSYRRTMMALWLCGAVVMTGVAAGISALTLESMGLSSPQTQAGLINFFTGSFGLGLVGGISTIIVGLGIEVSNESLRELVIMTNLLGLYDEKGLRMIVYVPERKTTEI